MSGLFSAMMTAQAHGRSSFLRSMRMRLGQDQQMRQYRYDPTIIRASIFDVDARRGYCRCAA